MAIINASEQTVPADNGEVNLLIARKVEPGHEENFEAWAHGILETAAGFPDHLGYGLFRPASEGEPWFLVHRFRNQAAFQRWQDSAERAQWFSNCLGHHHTEIARRELHGMETWFAKPGTARPAPPRWKMVISSGLAIFPISLALQRAARAVPGGSALRPADGRFRRRLQHPDDLRGHARRQQAAAAVAHQGLRPPGRVSRAS